MKTDKISIWLILLMRSVMFVVSFVVCSHISGKPLTKISQWWSILASFINIGTIVILWIICRHNAITYRELLRYEKQRKHCFAGCLWMILMFLIAMTGMYAAGWLCYGVFPYLAPMMIKPLPAWMALFNLCILPLTTTFAEEGVYLGCGVNRFKSRTTVLIPAFCYALQHCFIPMILDVRFITYRFLSFLPLTIWICHVYRQKKPICHIMMGHWFLNLATAVQIAVTSLYPEVYDALIVTMDIL